MRCEMYHAKTLKHIFKHRSQQKSNKEQIQCIISALDKVA